MVILIIALGYICYQLKELVMTALKCKRTLGYMLAIAAIALTVMLWCVKAHAQHVDLVNGDVLGQQFCVLDDKPRICMLVKKDDKFYRVAGDEDGEYMMWSVEVKETETSYFITHMVVIWKRGEGA